MDVSLIETIDKLEGLIRPTEDPAYKLVLIMKLRMQAQDLEKRVNDLRTERDDLQASLHQYQAKVRANSAHLVQLQKQAHQQRVDAGLEDLSDI